MKMLESLITSICQSTTYNLRSRSFKLNELLEGSTALYSDKELYLEPRLNATLDNLGFKNQRYHVLEATLSTRLDYWLLSRPKARIAGSIIGKIDLDTIYGDCDCNPDDVEDYRKEETDIARLNSVLLQRDNELLKLDEHVFYLKRYEKHICNYCDYRANYLIFVDAVDVSWGASAVSKWLIEFSNILKQEEETGRNRLRDLKAFDDLFLKPGLLEEIQQEVSDFLNSKELYTTELKLPWKQGYIFIGPPGNGKTKTIRRICSFWGLQHKDISAMLNDNGRINLNLATGRNIYLDVFIAPTDKKPLVITLEDLDKLVTCQTSEDAPDTGTITLHDLLTSLDGVDQVDSIILMATTNHPSKISEALTSRPGRFDRIWCIEKPDVGQICRLLTYHGIQCIDDSRIIEKLAEDLRDYSMAFAEHLVKALKMRYKRGRVKAEEIREVAQKIHEHNRLYREQFQEKQDRKDVEKYIL